VARLDVALLGPPQILVDGRAAAFPTTKALGLLAYVAADSGRAHQRAFLAELFWPDQPEGVARTNLRQALTRLRRALGDEEAGGDPPFLLVDGQTVQFNRQSDHQLDVAAFTGLLRASDSHAHRNPIACLACRQRGQQAAALYRGDFLEGFFLKDSAGFEEWVLVQRERLRRAAMEALDRLAQQAERFEDYDAARQAAVRQLELEPWREETHRALMRLLALGGQRAAALAQYEACQRTLAQELGVPPEAETTYLYERIRAGGALEAEPAAQERRRRALVLPAPVTALIGRETERAELNDLLAQPGSRLVTLLGLGGSGKTHLALTIAQDQAQAFEHGAAYVPLAALPAAQLQPAAILEALEVPLHGPQDHLALLLDYARTRELLLVLDGFEHVLAAEAAGAPGALGLISALLQQARRVALLVTSRERLGLAAERLYSLDGLAYPPGAVDVGALAEYGAVRLFLERARHVNRGFAAAGSVAQAVAQICRHAQGLPLAIELAAATVNSRPVEALAAELEHGVLSLSATRRDVPERHASVRAAFDYSWQLLSGAEQHVFQRLAVFAGGFEAAAAIAVAEAPAPLLGRLVDRCLLRLGPNAHYQLHDLLREFAAEKLRAAGEEARLRQRHLAYFLAWVEEIEPRLIGAEATALFARLDAAHDNLRAAMHSAWEQGDGAHGLRLAGGLWYFWYTRGYLSEGRRWLGRFLSLGMEPVETPSQQRTRARALDGLGVLAWRQGDHAEAAAALDEALGLMQSSGDRPGQAQVLVHIGILKDNQGDLAGAQTALESALAHCRALGDTHGTVRALHNLANVTVQLGDFESADGLFEECLAHYRSIGDRSGIALINLGLGNVAQLRGNLGRARAALRQSLDIARELGDLWNAASALNDLGAIAVEEGELALAQQLLDESLALLTTLQDDHGLASAQRNLGLLARARGDPAEAADHFKQGLRLYQSLSFNPGVAELLEQLAGVAASQRQAERAASLAGAAGRLRAEQRMSVLFRQPVWYAALLKELKAALGQAFDRAWSQGQQLTMEAAAEMAARD
jgi:predicted ATPase